jgi:hypothetical protein
MHQNVMAGLFRGLLENQSSPDAGINGLLIALHLSLLISCFPPMMFFPVGESAKQIDMSSWIG